MRENVQMFKNWYRLANPSKKYWFIAFFTVFCAGICSVVEPIFASNVITNINKENYLYTSIFLIIGFLFILLRKGVWDINYRIYYKLIGHSYLHLQNLIFNKLHKVKDSNLKKISKEKMINIIHSDVFAVADLADKLATRIGRLTRLFITIGAIFFINIPAAIVIIIIDVINYFILNYLNNKSAFYSKKTSESHDLQYSKFSEVFDSKELMEDLNITTKVKREFIKTSEHYIDMKNQSTIVASYIDNYFHIFYQFIILVVTLFMVFMVSQGNVSLTLYFMIVSYLTSGIEVANDFMNILPELKKANVSVNRVKTILDLTEEEIIEFGNNKTNTILGNIDFNKVSYNGTGDSQNNTIRDISFSIQSNEIALFLGLKNCGKRTIFNILRRSIHEDCGSIYVDGINLWDYTKKAHSTNLNYITTKPYFYKGSIIRNLHMVESNNDKIYAMCRKLDIYDYIMGLPHKFHTDINELSAAKQYIIGLARTLLTQSEIIVLYEFPIILSDSEEKNIKKILLELKHEKTIIIFSASESLIPLADKTYRIERGKIVDVIANNK